MNNRAVAKDLNIPATELTQKCSFPRGCHLTWVIRQVLMTEYNRLQHVSKEFLEDLLVELVYDAPAVAKAKSNVWASGKMVFADEYAQRLAKIVSRDSPFLVGDMI